MTEITSANVKELRDRTGAGMMDCKRALEEAKGNMEIAVENLRKKGIATAAKKAARRAADGLIGYKLLNNKAVLVEVNCETDFVAKTDDFKKFVSEIATYILENNPSDVDSLLGMKWKGKTVKEIQTELVAKVGENMGIRRFSVVSANNGEKLSQYIHGGDKIGTAVLISDPESKVSPQLAKEVAMHVAAMSPQYVRKEDVPASFIEKEKEIIKAQMGEVKKPAEILNKIIEGKLNKQLSEICLNDQIFVCDPEGKQPVGKFLSALGTNVGVRTFVRLQVGEAL